MAQIIQRSFVGGEISPSLQARADTVKYATGLNLCQNMIIRSQGGAYSRGGTRYIGALADSTKKGRLIPFSFNTEQTYILLFEENAIYIIKDGGFVLKPAATITGITQANPAVVTTSAAHTFVTGEQVTITGVTGMTEVNGNTYTITVLSPTTFQLDGIDSTAYTAYVSGGSAQSNGRYKVTTTYTEAELPRLGYAQSADVMTLTHPSHDPANLSRLADDNWSLAAISYSTTLSPPTFPSPATATITNITQANPAVVTTSAAHGFSNGDVIRITGVNGMIEVDNLDFTIANVTGTTFELLGIDSTSYNAYTSGGTATRSGSVATVGSGFGSFNKTYRYVVTAVDGDGIESVASAEVSLTSLSLSTTGGLRISWNSVAGAVYYRVYKDPSNNTNIYGWIGDSENTSFDDYNIAPITSDAPPEDRTPFSGADNKPSVVTYYQQRQIFANTNNEPQSVYTTQTGDYNSLRTSNPARDSDAITFSIASQRVNEIRHLISLDSLIILTSGAEWVVSEGQDKILTPSTIGFRPQSYNGSSWVKPVIINSTALYLQEKNARVRDLGYQFSTDSYTGNDLSIMAEHLIDEHTITDMTYADEPYGILWCVRDDGVMLGLTYQREHEVWAWHRHDTDGEFESVATITEDNRDALYTIVKRLVNGSTVRYVERMEKREKVTVEDAFCVDSGLSFNGNVANVEGATQANPVVITSTAHPFNNGDSVRIENVVGMTELNYNVYTVANATANTFELSGVDGTAYTAYTSGGTIKQVVTSLSGLNHLEGKSVVALADGVVVEGLVVSSGSITIARPSNIIHVGLSYIPAIELLDIDTHSPEESVKAQSVNVSKVTIEFEASRGGFVGPRLDVTSGIVTPTFKEIRPRFVDDGYNVIPLRTYKAEVFIDPLWSKGGGVRIEQRAPLPMGILSVSPKVDIGGN